MPLSVFSFVLPAWVDLLISVRSDTCQRLQFLSSQDMTLAWITEIMREWLWVHFTSSPSSYCLVFIYLIQYFSTRREKIMIRFLSELIGGY